MSGVKSDIKLLADDIRIHDPRPPLEPTYPATTPSKAENVGAKIDKNDISAVELHHAPTR